MDVIFPMVFFWKEAKFLLRILPTWDMAALLETNQLSVELFPTVCRSFDVDHAHPAMEPKEFEVVIATNARSHL